MRLLALVCLVSAVPTLAYADKKTHKDDAPTDDDAIEWGVGAQARRSRVSVRLQKIFLDGSPGPAEQDGGTINFIRRSKALDVVIGFGYDPINAVDGYYLSKGGDPMQSGDADHVTFDKNLSWFTFDFTFIGRAKLHKILSLRFGAGAGLGIIRGHGYRTSAICSGNQLQRDCLEDPMGERQDAQIDVPVFPVLNVLAGLELRPVRWLALDLDIGIHSAPYVGVGLTLFPLEELSMGAIEEFAQALDDGDYKAALTAYGQTDAARGALGKPTEAFLLALAGDHDEAARRMSGVRDAALIAAIVKGERDRTARWTKPSDAGSLESSEPLPFLGVYAGTSLALLQKDAALIDGAIAADKAKIPPVAGRLTFRDGRVREFKSIVDSDDGIGAMLETYGPNGLLYMPFASLRSVTFRAPRNFIDELVPSAEVVMKDGTTTTALVPLLYALSTTAGDATIRSGRMTTWEYVGSARRGSGMRDFVLDGGVMVGQRNVASIELQGASPRPRATPAPTPPPPTSSSSGLILLGLAVLIIVVLLLVR